MIVITGVFRTSSTRAVVSHAADQLKTAGVMVDVLSAVLSGANWGPFTVPFVLRNQIPSRSVGKGIGHFFGAMRIDAFIDADEFKSQMDEYVRVFRATRPEPGTSGPLLPGDPEREAEQVRRKEGIPLLPAVVKDLLDISEKIGAPQPSQATVYSRRVMV